MLALITPGDDVDRRALGGDDQVDADGTGHLGDADDGVLDVAGRHHHEVVQLVDDHEDERQGLRRLGLGFEVALVVDRGVLLAEGPGRHLAHAAAVGLRRRGDEALFDQLVVAGDVTHAVLGQHVVAALHLLDRPGEGVGRLLGVDDDRVEEVRQAVVLTQLDALGVDEDHLDLVRACPA